MPALSELGNHLNVGGTLADNQGARYDGRVAHPTRGS